MTHGSGAAGVSGTAAATATITNGGLDVNTPLRRRQRARLGAIAVTGLLVGGLLSAGPVPAAPGPGSPPQSYSYLRSTDGGETFTPLILSGDAAEAGFTDIAAAGGAVHALYDSNDPQPREMLYRRSADGGATFAAPVRLDQPVPGAALEVGDSSEGVVAASPDAVHVAWEDDRLLEADFTVPAPGLRVRGDLVLADGRVIAAEPDGGDPEDDDDNTVLPAGFVIPAGSVDPRTDRNVFIGDSLEPQDDRDDIHYTASTDGGLSFPMAVNVTDSPEVHDTDPALGAAGDLVVLAWQAEERLEPDTFAPSDVLLARSADGGATWERTNLTQSDGDQDDPAVAVEGNTVTVVFRDRQEDDPHIAYVHSTDAGEEFTAASALPRPEPTGDFTAETPPAVLADGDAVHVLACHEDTDSPTDGFDLLYWRSADGGATFAPPVVVDRGEDECTSPAIDGADGILRAVYERDVAGEADVFLVGSTDGGQTWSAPRNLSSDPHSSSSPSISVDTEDRNAVHVAWSDETEFLFSLREEQALPLEDGGEGLFANEDVIRFDGAAYEMVLDGSDVGLTNFRIDALAQVAPDQFVLSFSEAGPVPGVGLVNDSDLVLFEATGLGDETAGSFSLYLAGSELGLDGPSEDVDAVEIQGRRLFLSSTGPFSIPTPDGLLAGGEEDILVCERPADGGTGCTTLSVAFDGSAIGLDSGADEDLDAFAFDTVSPEPFVNEDGEMEVDERQAFFSFRSDWSVPTAEGGPSDLGRCRFPGADVTEGEPVFGLEHCGGEDVPLVKVFAADAHFLERDITALELEF